MSFARRHIGPSARDRDEMLRVVGAEALDALMAEAVPASIRLDGPLDLPPALDEHEYHRELAGIAGRNRVLRSYIGLGYHDTVTPAVIRRMVFENPGWYTPYTPYQSEIAQGRLESLLNFQTMVADLTGMEVANASLLDEATAAAEAMTLLRRVQPAAAQAAGAVFLVSDRCLPQTQDVLRSRAEPLGIVVEVGSPSEWTFHPGVFGALLQYPGEDGRLDDLTAVIAEAHRAGAAVAVAADLLALVLCTPPGEMGADVVFGNSQRFGVPLGFGGPHAAFFATRQAFVRQMPGRIIGVSQDEQGHVAYRMALATREQHIRREKATSNICTAQALLANLAAMYGVYHGPDGLRRIAATVHGHAASLAGALRPLGISELNGQYFDTLRLRVPSGAAAVRAAALARGINLRFRDDGTIGVALDETVTADDLRMLVEAFAAAGGVDAAPALAVLAQAGAVVGRQADAAAASAGPSSTEAPGADGIAWTLPTALQRTSPFMTHEVFRAHRSETEMMRYIRRLERKDLGLDTSMIPLGSCTMKLNAAAEMLPLTWDGFSRLHPFVPLDQAAGYLQLFEELERALQTITGMAAVSLQPNSGAQGELAGLLAVRAYYRATGRAVRDVVLIPASAHGTNPASAAMAGMRVVVVKTSGDGSIDLEDLRARVREHADRLACLMLTYPSTHGVFEDAVLEVTRLVHDHGGQVYMDGANMNAQVGLTSPGAIGADVCHLNLHKTFAIPHGGGGPGMGPIAVAAHLAPYLPGHPLEGRAHAVAAAPWGSASILTISYGYIRLLGPDGLMDATRHAILGANYVKARLEPHYPVLYARDNGRVAHELIFDLRGFRSGGVEEMDVAKRLMDYGFHAPTVSFPVAGTLMVEPTESESKEELDRFCDAMIQIRQEIEDVVTGRADRADNVLKHAPHTAEAIAVSDWGHPYSRETAAYPLPFVRRGKFWPSVGRIDNTYGDRHLFCSCPPVDTTA